MKTSLRIATLEDIPILKIWDQQPHVLEATGSEEEDWNWEIEIQRNVDWQKIFIAELDKRPIGVVQIIDPHLEITQYWGKIEPNKRAIDIWIGDYDDIGKGYGTEMMKQAFQICFSNQQVDEILIDPLSSNKKAIRFYKKLGFEVVEERLFEDSLCLVMSLKR